MPSNHALIQKIMGMVVAENVLAYTVTCYMADRKFQEKWC
jgi:hypothetical protein